jgi:hypothetical protein
MLPTWLSSIVTTCARGGLNLYGIADGRPYDRFLSGCQSAIVLANGGTALWDAFVVDVQQSPLHLSQQQHPFDAFVHRLLLRSDPNPPPSRRWIRCAAEPEEFIDFRPLGREAGLGFQSNMGLLINPEYGLWIGLRAVLLSTEKLEVSQKKQEQLSPCANCTEKPCISACPGSAVSETGWDMGICSKYHNISQDCHGRCHSRLACPIGKKHRHGTLQHHYHNARSGGRVMLAHHLGIRDAKKGIDPNWREWGSKSTK